MDANTKPELQTLVPEENYSNTKAVDKNNANKTVKKTEPSSDACGDFCHENCKCFTICCALCLCCCLRLCGGAFQE